MEIRCQICGKSVACLQSTSDQRESDFWEFGGTVGRVVVLSGISEGLRGDFVFVSSGVPGMSGPSTAAV
jgi:hypothetical protein